MTFEQWADVTFGSRFVDEETLTYFRMSAAWEAAVLAEREACAKVCEQDDFQIYETAERCAAAIRARGNK